VSAPHHLSLSIPEDALREFVLRQRWFGSKSREIGHVTVVAAPVVRTEEPALALALVEIRFHAGTHELYNVPIGFRRSWDGDAIAEVEGWTAYDALADSELARELMRLMRTEADVAGGEAMLEFRSTARGGREAQDVRPMGAEQSNSSLVFDETIVLKVYRRVEAGVNPELEVLRFLTDNDFPSIPGLEGWIAYVGTPLEATLAIAQDFVPSEGDGWELALGALEAGEGDFIEQLVLLGETSGAMHSALASDASDPTFCPEEPRAESLALLTASVDEEIEELFATLPDLSELEPIAGRGEEVREQLRGMTHVGAVGRVIRTHGDFHLGQAIWTGESWTILDFEGEPARSVVERRRKRSPLRDVAGMLRSFAYAASAAELERGVEPPAGWEERARDAFLSGYLAEVDANLIPSASSFERLLAVFELEKAVYELRYELDNRPGWVRIPVAGILRLLERAPA
jgi:maltokinase